VRANDVPGYLCLGRGRVAVRVTVDRTGAVVKAEIDAARSSQADECMLENAIRSAKRARFNASSTEQQNGTVFFLFLQQ
jgi:TonB family protein